MSLLDKKKKYEEKSYFLMKKTLLLMLVLSIAVKELKYNELLFKVFSKRRKNQ